MEKSGYSNALACLRSELVNVGSGHTNLSTQWLPLEDIHVK